VKEGAGKSALEIVISLSEADLGWLRRTPGRPQGIYYVAPQARHARACMLWHFPVCKWHHCYSTSTDGFGFQGTIGVMWRIFPRPMGN
jgi:hypothetical protein